jgi:hypothetical protein
MTRLRYSVVLTLVLALLPTALSAEPLELVTEEEARRPAPPWDEAPFDLRGSGPTITIRSPRDGEETVSPLEVDVEFGPGPSGLPVREESLKVAYVLLISIDLTDKVLPHLQQNRLHVQGVKIPAGRHKIRVSIADAGGNTSTTTLRVVVR